MAMIKNVNVNSSICISTDNIKEILDLKMVFFSYKNNIIINNFVQDESHLSL